MPTAMATMSKSVLRILLLPRATLTAAQVRTEDVVGRHGSVEALESELADGFDFREVLHRRQHALRDEDLARLRLATEARGEVGHGADRPVVQAPLETDRADRRVALGDADAEVEGVAALPPPDEQLVHPLAHGHRHANGTRGRVRHRHWVVEEDHHAVAGEALEGALVLEDEPAHLCVVLAQDPHDLFGFGGFREGREPAKVEEDHRDLAPVALEWVFGITADDHFGELRGEEALETLQ